LTTSGRLGGRSVLLLAAAGAASRASWLRIRELAVLPSSLKMKVASEELVDSEPSSVEDEELEEVEDEEEVDRERTGSCSRHINIKSRSCSRHINIKSRSCSRHINIKRRSCSRHIIIKSDHVAGTSISRVGKLSMTDIFSSLPYLITSYIFSFLFGNIGKVPGLFVSSTVADPDPGSGAFLTPGSGIPNPYF
jgi:hypothetical protein